MRGVHSIRQASNSSDGTSIHFGAVAPRRSVVRLVMHVRPFKEQAARRQAAVRTPPADFCGIRAGWRVDACRPLGSGGREPKVKDSGAGERTRSLEVLHCRLLVTSSTLRWHRFGAYGRLTRPRRQRATQAKLFSSANKPSGAGGQLAASRVPNRRPRDARRQQKSKEKSRRRRQGHACTGPLAAGERASWPPCPIFSLLKLPPSLSTRLSNSREP